MNLLQSVILAGIGVIAGVIFLTTSIIVEESRQPPEFANLSESEITLIAILIDQLQILDGEFSCDYGIFTDKVTCLGLQENVEILENGYRLTNGTRSGAMFEDSEGIIQKLKGEHPNGFLHNRDDFTVKEIGTKYYLITQEPTLTGERKTCLEDGDTWTTINNSSWCEKQN